MSGKLLTRREVAERLGRSVEFVRGLIRRRRLASIRINGRYYVPEWSLVELLRPKAPAVSAFPMEIKPNRKRHKKR